MSVYDEIVESENSLIESLQSHISSHGVQNFDDLIREQLRNHWKRLTMWR